MDGLTIPVLVVFLLFVAALAVDVLGGRWIRNQKH
jgi:hypothetical protein